MEIRNMAVIGAGTMGNGIAQVAALAGLQVSLHDIGEEYLQRGLANIESSLKRFVKAGKIAQDDLAGALGRIRPTKVIGALPHNKCYRRWYGCLRIDQVPHKR